MINDYHVRYCRERFTVRVSYLDFRFYVLFYSIIFAGSLHKTEEESDDSRAFHERSNSGITLDESERRE